ncbi:N-acetylmuramic acid 6-phosphate etherase [Romboutsia weinsteinii]|uniref:N-acetylmuramic acid 6-phosphate etherase n=1 Tax=Romboutsia weinsteinii TaxID=2020949 RepID=A0A371J9I3_9FIRM|nr:N-acetylmuramic acid 6-phosphate etherase [Romboutsia weinsteinii]RDY29328.1 N-acetylmuramic acid 6-phosphate etherase [Romboutsia weinsteinii]
MVKIKHLSTEGRNKDSVDIDIMSVKDVITTINNEDKTVAFSIEKELDSIEKVVSEMINTYKNGGKIVYMGAGTSGRLGVLDSAECPPTYGIDPNRIVGLIAGGEKAFIKAVENAEDNRELGISDLKNINLSSNDMLIGIAASGRTPYVEEGLKYANEVGAKTATLTCNKGSLISRYAQNNIEINVGPEVVTGSTRMKAGTAQKLVLTMMSTTLMISLGKVYSNLMVDVKITNEKLNERAINIVTEIADCSREEAIDALSKSNGHAKSAIIMIMLKVEYKEAIEKLDMYEGSVRRLLMAEI